MKISLFLHTDKIANDDICECEYNNRFRSLFMTQRNYNLLYNLAIHQTIDVLKIKDFVKCGSYCPKTGHRLIYLLTKANKDYYYKGEGESS